MNHRFHGRISFYPFPPILYTHIIFIFAGYGFVDFETIASAEAAVKGLQAKGVQAQMAKVGIWFLRRLNRVRCACK